eukprot:CAMPEP_0206479290 /NCGR_PEP_ID=MMETSP0324_2-20121206/36581_1 /ASSEMBLY_ACC=CAM_ASM_000836 /TAXON_ID=2866 /ORGANISM="Crypthecodinium cohnii, Strain Seligo" /LENGTH=41 /DNA_ID= /DNA_START= /DNA_END= /DNA_ORIENTATION=
MALEHGKSSVGEEDGEVLEDDEDDVVTLLSLGVVVVAVVAV